MREKSATHRCSKLWHVRPSATPLRKATRLQFVISQKQFRRDLPAGRRSPVSVTCCCGRAGRGKPRKCSKRGSPSFLFSRAATGCCWTHTRLSTNRLNLTRPRGNIWICFPPTAACVRATKVDSLGGLGLELLHNFP